VRQDEPISKGRKAMTEDAGEIADVDSFDQSLETRLEAAGMRFPAGRYSGDPELAPVICLPVPAFAIRFLIQQEGWPLGWLSQVVGVPESGKSALAAEIVRWHQCHAGGCGVLLETEQKCQDIYETILEDCSRFRTFRCRTLEEWKEKLVNGIEGGIQWQQSAAAIGSVPVAFGVDSVIGALPKKLFAEIAEKGHSRRGANRTAEKLKEVFGLASRLIRSQPYTLVAVSHMKPQEHQAPGSGQWRVVRNVAGGIVLNSFQAIELQTSRSSGPGPGRGIDREESEERGILLDLSTQHNRFGTPACIQVELLWVRDRQLRDALGNFQQRVFFDWHSASIQLLIDLSSGQDERGERIRDMLPLQPDCGARRVACRTLGINSSSSETYRTAGEILESRIAADTTFRDALYAATGIRRRPLFRGDIQYSEQVRQATDGLLGLERERLQGKAS
jgi:hypothetical protein